MNYIYILQCHDGSYYTGWTNDLPRRLHSHSAGKGAKYTKSRLPVTLVYFEEFPTKEEAMSREWHSLPGLFHSAEEKTLALHTPSLL